MKTNWDTYVPPNSLRFKMNRSSEHFPIKVKLVCKLTKTEGNNKKTIFFRYRSEKSNDLRSVDKLRIFMILNFGDIMNEIKIYDLM